MKTYIFTLTSPIHDKTSIEQHTSMFLGELQAAGLDYEYLGEDFRRYGEGDINLIYIRTGGTEGYFLKQTNITPRLTTAPVYLLASGESNSLAASVEILSWLRNKGIQGKIFHGSNKYLVEQIQAAALVEKTKKTLHGQRAGIIGQPSDWLIASHIDVEAVKARLGVELINIDIQELIEEYRRTDNNIEISDVAQKLQPCQSKYFVGALRIYKVLRLIIERYHLNALTLRCFDLLDAIHNTGCMALALLNSEGVPAACEGDVPALLTMMLCHALTGHTGFQANPSRINPETGEIVFAHCTVPLDMIKCYQYDTHFESGIGVGLHGELPEGDATIVKLNGDMKQWYSEDVTLKRNTYKKQLCRTQIVLHTQHAANYLLNHPLGNHQIILTGHHRNLIDMFMQSVGLPTT
ncbi:MAG: hypothetical protein IJS13_00875 [Paludibacteraceae bacterium]|nr:hypothetical protein [Paludibacteraceae bacterium]